jgi:hypothetical protein
MMNKIGVDPDCVELARKFLAEVYVVEAPSESIQSLSEDIQAAIEDWFFAHPIDSANGEKTDADPS